MNTIFAPVTGHGKSGVAVYRISGPSSFKALEKLINAPLEKMQARTMYLRKIYHPSTAQQIDEALVVYFKNHSSFTGEDSAEIHIHGSVAVRKLLTDALVEIEDLRLALPGEFSSRAFLNGKFDLTAAEGLADLIDAQTEAQHKQAIRQLSGGLANIYDNWRKSLLKIMSLFEAYIDFPDEDIPSSLLTNIENNINNLLTEIRSHLTDNNRGERLRNGLKLAIVGRPNVGKSSLMNYLLKREAAIVSNIAGTTRDIIEGHLDIGGYPIILQDTAGIRNDSKDEIEEIGINRAKEAMLDADIKIIMHDASNFHEEDFFNGTTDENTIIVFNKADLNSNSLEINNLSHNCLNISIKTNLNMDLLNKSIFKIAENIASPSVNPQITRERHRLELMQAVKSLESFDINSDLILAAEDLRMTIRYLSNITGVITVDEILGEIFSNFCIGK